MENRLLYTSIHEMFLIYCKHNNYISELAEKTLYNLMLYFGQHCQFFRYFFQGVRDVETYHDFANSLIDKFEKKSLKALSTIQNTANLSKTLLRNVCNYKAPAL